MDRRTVLKGGIVLALASHTTVASGTIPTDPIIVAIEEFHDGMRRFGLIDDVTADGLKEEFDCLVRAPNDVLEGWDKPIRTHEGAVAALRLAVEENRVYADSAVAARMVEAVLAYLTATT